MKTISFGNSEPVLWPRLKPLSAGLVILGACLAGPASAATLADFGYQNRNVNGVLAQGHRPLLVILANFQTGAAFTNTPAYYDDLIFNELRPSSVNGFFLAMSNGRFYWSRGGVIGPLSFSAAERNSPGNWPSDGVYLSNVVYHAMVSGLFNFATYDANNDGHVTQDELGIIVISNDNPPNDSGCDCNGATRSTGTVKPGGLTVDWGSGSSWVASLNFQTGLAVMCEETEETLGALDIYGAPGDCLSLYLTSQSCNLQLGANSTNIYYLDPWNRMELGWCEPRIRSLTAGGVETISATQASDPTAPVILYDPTTTSEFFMLEYRTYTNSALGPGYDANVATNGLAVWHVQQDANHNPTQVPSLSNPGNDLVVWNEGTPSFQRGGNQLWGSGATTPNLSWLASSTSTHLHILPFNPGDGSITVQWLSPGDTWVDFNYTGLPQLGTFANPFPTFSQGFGSVTYGGTLHLKTGVSSETGYFNKAVNVLGYNGSATIGRH